jgi:hypothetical protein
LSAVVAYVVYDRRVLNCPWCREPVPVAVTGNGHAAANHRCIPCQREIRVSPMVIRDDLRALEHAVPPLVVLSTEQARILAEQAMALTLAQQCAKAPGLP